jgi:anion-transporting  ArsA/GET3 family ATPase
LAALFRRFFLMGSCPSRLLINFFIEEVREMSDKKRQREIEGIENEIMLLGQDIESMKNRKQKLENQLQDAKEKSNPIIDLSKAMSKEEVQRLLNTWGCEKIKFSSYDSQCMQDVIDEKIADMLEGDECISDCNCAMYYKIGSYRDIKVICYDDAGEWEKKCEEFDAKKDWVQIYAK